MAERVTREDLEALRKYAIDGREHDHPPSKCGACGGVWERSTGEKDQPLPKPGMFCVCGYCCAICRYTDELNGEPVPAKELRQLPRADRTKLERIQRTLRLTVATIEGRN